MTILVTGGAGFIGSNFILNWFSHSNEPIINLDKLTYAANLKNLESIQSRSEYTFIEGDIANKTMVATLLQEYQPRAIINFAAETHVDRSIQDPEIFVRTNVLGVASFLECIKNYWLQLPSFEKAAFRFLHVSTDEVYGSLTLADAPFTEKHPYQPNSPYSASKAASDHIVRAYYHTYALPTITTNCSNNYGPHQHPEKLIPLLISNALAGKVLPIYGDGRNRRDWLHVLDHCEALETVLAKGHVGEVYNIGGRCERENIDIAYGICDLLDQLAPGKESDSYKNLIQFVDDRAGHDRRYAVDIGKIESELGWQPRRSFEEGLLETVKWYLAKIDYREPIFV